MSRESRDSLPWSIIGAPIPWTSRQIEGTVRLAGIRWGIEISPRGRSLERNVRIRSGHRIGSSQGVPILLVPIPTFPTPVVLPERMPLLLLLLVVPIIRPKPSGSDGLSTRRVVRSSRWVRAKVGCLWSGTVTRGTRVPAGGVGCERCSRR